MTVFKWTVMARVYEASNRMLGVVYKLTTADTVVDRRLARPRIDRLMMDPRWVTV